MGQGILDFSGFSRCGDARVDLMKIMAQILISRGDAFDDLF